MTVNFKIKKRFLPLAMKGLWVVVLFFSVCAVFMLHGVLRAYANGGAPVVESSVDQGGVDEDVIGKGRAIDLRETYPNRHYSEVEGICQEVKKILERPENKDVLMSSEEFYAFRAENKGAEHYVPARRKRFRFVTIPDDFKDFSVPDWRPVSNGEAYDQLGDFIQRYEESEIAPLFYGQDYVFQKTHMDLNEDGQEEVFYQQIGGGNLLLVGKDCEGPVCERFRGISYFARRQELFYYQGEPYLFWFSGMTGVSLNMFYASPPAAPFGFLQPCHFIVDSGQN